MDERSDRNLASESALEAHRIDGPLLTNTTFLKGPHLRLRRFRALAQDATESELIMMTQEQSQARQRVTVDIELKAWSWPLKDEEYRLLEQSIIDSKGARDPLIVWSGHNVIVDGHNRLEICLKHKLPFTVIEMSFDRIEDAKRYIRINQLARRNLTTWEKIQFARDIKPLLKAAADVRMKAGVRHPHQNSDEGKDGVPQPPPPPFDGLVNCKGTVLEKLAKITGTSHDTLHKGMAVLDQAEQTNDTALLRRIKEDSISIDSAAYKGKTRASLARTEKKKEKMREMILAGSDGSGDYSPGDLNKIIHGDAIKVLKRIPPNSVHLILTSPPYVLYELISGKNVEMPWRKYFRWIQRILHQCRRVLVRGGRIILVFDSMLNRQDDSERRIDIGYHLGDLTRKVGLKYYQEHNWRKGVTVGKHMARGTPNSCRNHVSARTTETIFVYARETFTMEFEGEGSDIGEDFHELASDDWFIPQQTTNDMEHPHVFPEMLADAAIRLYCPVGSTVLDPFSGTGTTCAVAAWTGRNYLGIEVREKFIEPSRRRIKERTPKRYVSKYDRNEEFCPACGHPFDDEGGHDITRSALCRTFGMALDADHGAVISGDKGVSRDGEAA